MLALELRCKVTALEAWAMVNVHVGVWLVLPAVSLANEYQS